MPRDKTGLMIAIGGMRPKGMRDEKESSAEEKRESDPGLVASADEVLAAVASKNASALADALYDFFMQCDSMPHPEGEHEEEY